MKTDVQIQKDVMDELKWAPFLNSSEIGVAVKDGIVTLSGQVDSYAKKVAAEKAAKKVRGVRAIAEDIHIGVSPTFRKTDTEIADAVMNALKWHTAVQEEKIKVSVEDGCVKLEGEVDWDYQRKNAVNTVQNLSGVRYVSNLLTIKPAVTTPDVKQKIFAAFHRSATVDASKITAEVSGSKVILKGSVRSFAEKKDAENAAWSAPGVTNVDSKLQVYIPDYAYEDL